MLICASDDGHGYLIGRFCMMCSSTPTSLNIMEGWWPMKSASNWHHNALRNTTDTLLVCCWKSFDSMRKIISNKHSTRWSQAFLSQWELVAILNHIKI